MTEFGFDSVRLESFKRVYIIESSLLSPSRFKKRGMTRSQRRLVRAVQVPARHSRMIYDGTYKQPEDLPKVASQRNLAWPLVDVLGRNVCDLVHFVEWS